MLSDGGQGVNDIGVSYNVTGIGIADAAKIVYYYETLLMQNTDEYKDARNGTIWAANSLAGSTVSINAVASVKEAWKAVGLDFSNILPISNCFSGSFTNLSNVAVIASGTTYSGDVYIPQNIKISGTVIFQNANVLLEYGTTITVPTGSTLQILGSRLSTCSGRWEGINVEAGGHLIMDETLSASSLIENAEKAVSYND